MFFAAGKLIATTLLKKKREIHAIFETYFHFELT